MKSMKAIFIIIFLAVSFFSSYGQKYNFSRITMLPGDVNVKSELSKPYLMPDNLVLFFVNTIQGKGQEVWWAVKKDNQWQPAAKFESKVNLGQNNFMAGANYDNSRMYVMNMIKDRRVEKCELFEVENINGMWNTPKRSVLPELNISGKFLDITVAQDENIMIISMESQDSQGKEDLYVSKKNEDGSWTTPMNMGKDINTEMSEIAPFLTDGGRTLFFASNGRKGLGDYDVYVARRTDTSWTHWSTPVNLGSGINTSSFDAYLMLSNQNEAYFVSNRNGGVSQIYVATFEKGKDDILTTPQNSDLPLDTRVIQAGNDLNRVENMQKDAVKKPSGMVKGTKKIIFMPGQKKYVYQN